MDDLIRREYAIGVIDGWFQKIGLNPEICVDAIKALPSEQLERKTAKWEIYVISMLDGEGCRCSECGFEGAPYWDFCPNCGADMRGVQEC